MFVCYGDIDDEIVMERILQKKEFLDAFRLQAKSET